MHSPLRVKIQNALNKALQLEHTDVLFVGGRRRNRKRRKHAKEKRKCKKEEGKHTPVLKPKTYNGNKGKYVTLVADDISLSPSIIDELFDGHVADFNNEADEHQDEMGPFDKEENEHLPELCDTDSCLMEELCINTASHERPCSCDTGYNSEEDRKPSNESEQEEAEDDGTKLNTEQSNEEVEEQTDDDEVFMENGKVFSPIKDRKDIDKYCLMAEIQKAEEYLESIITGDEEQQVEGTDKESEVNNQHDTGRRVEDDIPRQLADQLEYKLTGKTDVKLSEDDSQHVPKSLPEPRVIPNFCYDEEDEVEIYTKQPRTWFKRKPHEDDEELRPLICCGKETGVGLACCTIL